MSQKSLIIIPCFLLLIPNSRSRRNCIGNIRTPMSFFLRIIENIQHIIYVTVFPHIFQEHLAHNIVHNSFFQYVQCEYLLHGNIVYIGTLQFVQDRSFSDRYNRFCASFQNTFLQHRCQPTQPDHACCII